MNPFYYILKICLLVGRQSLTRLSAFMAEFTCFQIVLTKAYAAYDWREDIKKLMLNAGLLKRETVFLFSDTQVSAKLHQL